PLPSSASDVLPITCPGFTSSPLLTLAEDKLLYTVKYFPCRIITIIPSPRLETALTVPPNTAFTDEPAAGVEMVIPGLSVSKSPTLLLPYRTLTNPLSTGHGRLP